MAEASHASGSGPHLAPPAAPRGVGTVSRKRTAAIVTNSRRSANAGTGSALPSLALTVFSRKRVCIALGRSV